MFHEFPKWMYGPQGEAQVFERVEDIPQGWQDHPSKFAREREDGRGEGGSGEGSGEGREGKPNDDTGGLTRAEIVADLQRREVKFKITQSTRALYQLLLETIEAQP